MAQGFQFVAEKLQAHGPGTGQRIDIEDAPAQGDLPFLRYLGFGLVTLLLQPLHQVERVAPVPARYRPSAPCQDLGRESALQQRNHTGDNHRDAARPGQPGTAQRRQRFQALADHVRVRKPVLVRQNLPSRVKQRLRQR